MLLKIDVQGSELEVLRGATKLIDGPGIDFLFVEFGGEKDVMEFILGAGYTVYSSLYIIYPRPGAIPDFGHWDVESENVVSTGRRTYLGWPKQHAEGPMRYCNFFAAERKKAGTIVTNLVCVHERVLPLFQRAAEAVVKRGPGVRRG